MSHPLQLMATHLPAPTGQSIAAPAIELSNQASAVQPPNDEEDICPISLERIASIPATDIFTTADGKKYNKACLKVWLSSHNSMPHSTLPAAPADLARLWPTSERPRHKISRGDGAVLALTAIFAAGAIGCISRGVILNKQEKRSDGDGVYYFFGAGGFAIFTLIFGFSLCGKKSQPRPITAQDRAAAGV